MEVLQINKLDQFCSLSQRSFNEVQERSPLEPLLTIGTIDYLTYEDYTRQPYNDNWCLFRALALHLHGTQRLKREFSRIFILFIKKTGGLCANHFQVVHTNDMPTVEDQLTLNSLLYDIDIVDGNVTKNLLEEMCRRTKILCDY